MLCLTLHCQVDIVVHKLSAVKQAHWSVQLYNPGVTKRVSHTQHEGHNHPYCQPRQL